MDILSVYHHEIPDFMMKICESKEMQRLKNVGMNCGCEYTQFPLFKNIAYYSRYEHSLGAGLIVWHFTRDTRQSVAALLHDIATPCFAHTIDFLNGDYEKQESTEERTFELISNSKEICKVLNELNLSVEEVADYHLYPIADNDSPKLSSDRLEYTLGNIVNFGFGNVDTVKRIYDDLTVSENKDELVFRSKEIAVEFSLLMMKCSNVYVAKEDRFSMQMLAELMSYAKEKGVITLDDLYTDEKRIIQLLNSDEDCMNRWKRFCSYSMIVEENEQSRIIPAKKRYIDPCFENQRVSTFSEDFSKQLEQFKNLDFTKAVSAI